MLNPSYLAALQRCSIGLLCFTCSAVGLAETPLNLVPALRQNIATEQQADAQVEAVKQSTLSAQTSGQVLDVYFDADQRVEKGEILMRFKDTEQQAGLAASQAQLKETVARINEAKQEYVRVKQLTDKKAMSESALDTAMANLQAAQARLSAAKAAVQQAQEQVDYTVVKAPFSGIVLQRHIEPGELANPGQPLMTGFSTEQLRVVAAVPQNMIETVRKHSRARIWVQTDEGMLSMPGENIVVLPHSEQGHSFKVRVDLPRNTSGLYPGMFVKVAFVTGEEERLVVPLKAVAFRGEVRAVYVAQQSTEGGEPHFSMRQVRLGQVFDTGMVEVLSGLQSGEQIAYDPVRASVLLKEQRAQRSAQQQQAHNSAH